MSHYVSKNKKFGEWEVRGTMGNVVASFKKETHARIWAACLNGESSIVKNSPYVKDSEKDETIV